MTTALEEPNVAISDDVLARSERPLISVVIPLYNEEESIPHLCSALTAALQRYGKPYEIIVVDDGSKDRSFGLLAEQTQRDRHLIVIQLRRNFGQTAAFAAGFNNARRCRDYDGRRLAERPRRHPAADGEDRRGIRHCQRLAQGPAGPFPGPPPAVDDRQPSDLQRHGRAPARLRLFAQSLPPRCVAACAPLWGIAPLHPCAGKPGRRNGDRGAGQSSRPPVRSLQVRHQPGGARGAGPDYGLVSGRLFGGRSMCLARWA